MNTQGSFRCDVSGLDTHSIILLNGEIPSCVGAMAKDIPWQAYREGNNLVIKVEEGIIVEKPLQIIFLCGSKKVLNLDFSIRIELEPKSSLAVLYCTDSDKETKASVKNVMDIKMSKESYLSITSLQNTNNDCKIENELKAELAELAELKTFFASLNGGELLNTQEINLKGIGSSTQTKGLYLVDEHQKVGNKVKINHLSANTKSVQLFKGILDDSSSGWFEGHIYVEQEAQQTEAFQTNKNLLLTPKAKFKTKPFLEIYADDVKCSHGATVGQLDENALFYMRCRGISEFTAKRLLMFAFASEVIQGIGIPALEGHLSKLVKRRLKGELGVCSDCAEQCSVEKACCSLPWCAKE